MGHDNIDKEIKKKLEGRLLQPSASAWDKLDSLLEKEEKKTKKGIPFYWMAASIVVLLGLFFVFQKSTNNDGLIVEPVIVEVESKKDKAIEIEKVNSVKEEAIDQEKTFEQTVEVIVKKSQKSKKIEELVKNELPTAYEINDLEIKKEEALIAQKKEDENKVEKHQADLDFEVDSLLAVATANISQKNKKEPEIVNTVIDANALLADVEEELDMSFKEKVFKKIKNGFKKTKTAVAKRND